MTKHPPLTFVRPARAIGVAFAVAIAIDCTPQPTFAEPGTAAKSACPPSVLAGAVTKGGEPLNVSGAPHDWDFLIGRWNVKHRRLKARLAGSTEWEEFNGTSVLWITIAAIFIIAAGLVRFDLEYRSWRWHRFARQARSSVNFDELHTWAGNLVRSNQDHYIDYKGTNVPPAVAALFPRRPQVWISSSVVYIGGWRGTPSIAVGPHNWTITEPRVETLSPGVFLLKD